MFFSKKKETKQLNVGITTFHWATNYGAILQAFALQTWLKSLSARSEIISYCPNVLRFKTKARLWCKRDWGTLSKERKLRRFRKRYLTTTRRRYGSNRSLFRLANRYDAVICGSDQVWNPSFTMKAEGGITLSYYLNFAGESKRVAYAPSFGCEELTAEMQAAIKPELARFAALSVRENSGKEILKRLGFESEVVLDPTLLLTAADYERELTLDLKKRASVFAYILQKNQRGAQRVAEFVQKLCQNSTVKPFYSQNESLEDWLSYLRNAEYVVTNSFHGTVFALLFHKNFIALPVEGTGASMNDRIQTLLKTLNLESRVLADFDVDKIEGILESKIDWSDVESRLTAAREKSKAYLAGALGIKKP